MADRKEREGKGNNMRDKEKEKRERGGNIEVKGGETGAEKKKV